ncbi:glycosyltransferase family 4 protein [Oceanobacillus luteolus]|uniref:glycosyltransferase family 4 protein n=1 Tax=Oceanobacillus luteolus TaxID=1274358 RepID=UPI002040F8E6|nr:glycosyltransferase family 4 protein [Oceanobacillus luteolus]
MKKILFISNISGKLVSNFSISSIMAAKELGFEFHLAANWSKSTSQIMKTEEEKYGIKLHHIDFNRNPFHPKNFHAYKQLLELIRKEKYYIVHCNTPVGGILGRLAAKKAGINKVIYMAHGFHFFSGAPLKNWLLYYPAEAIFALLTDELITINKEDYNRAKKFKLRNNGSVHYSPGVGINISKYSKNEIDKDKLRLELGIPQNAFVVISVGELNSNKNHEVIIKAIEQAKDEEIYYLICGEGNISGQLKRLANSLGLRERVKFLGFRSDIPRILKIADLFAFPSKREGLGLAGIEAMASGLALITSNVHGINDYSIHNITSFKFNPNDVIGFSEAIITLKNNKELLSNLSENNIEFAKRYDRSMAVDLIKSVYEKI